MISPCFTSPAGSAFFTAQMITSPTWATFRLNLPLLLEPRSTLMHIACLSPVLSAMSRYDCCWIMSVVRQFFSGRRGRLQLATSHWQPATRPSSLFRRLARHHFLGRHDDRPLGGALDDAE